MMLAKQDLLKTDLNKVLICGQNFVRTLSGVSCQQNQILQWFTEFCSILTEIINLLGAYNKVKNESIQNPIQKTFLLYLTQLLTSLSLLINILSKEDEIQQILIEARNCIIKQIGCCLEGIEVTLNSGTTIIEPSGTFIKWMDAALDKISEIDLCKNPMESKQICADAKELCEEVLSHAMSIAQVSLPEDTVIIKGSCQAVFGALNTLTNELNNSPPRNAMVNLFIDVCSDKLCMLERKVNSAVLKLCLKTFSNFTLPLQKIKEFCFDQNNKGKVDELDELVVEFDLHVDRIMQIGLFAVSCSSDITRGIKIRSCLASLEALESELVPVLTSVLLDNSTHNINCANLLITHWRNQAFCLQKLIYLIIDPFAFCQVVYEQSTEIIDQLSDTLKNKKALFKSNDIQELINISTVLRTLLNTSQTEFSQNEVQKIKFKLKDFNSILDEVETATKVLLNESRVSFDSCLRLLKRCKILLTILKRLWQCLAEITFNNKQNESTANEINSHVEKPVANYFLDHIINRGKQLLQDRSVLYKSPMKNPNINLGSVTKSKEEISTLSKVVRLRQPSFVNPTVNKSKSSFDLEITGILSEMTNLSLALNESKNQ